MHGARIEARLGKHLGSASAVPYLRNCHYPEWGIDEMSAPFGHLDPGTAPAVPLAPGKVVPVDQLIEALKLIA